MVSINWARSDRKMKADFAKWLKENRPDDRQAFHRWKRSAEDFYQKHDQPKEVWVRELVKRACPRLRAVELPAAWAAVAAQVAPRCTAKADQIGSLMEGLRREVPEFRRRQALAYPVAGMVALIAMALFSGVAKG